MGGSFTSVSSGLFWFRRGFIAFDFPRTLTFGFNLVAVSDLAERLLLSALRFKLFSFSFKTFFDGTVILEAVIFVGGLNSLFEAAD